jgi:hypothetical protein
VPRVLKVLVWIAVFAACAGAGAVMASRSDPFPPGVPDPGARVSTSPSRTPPPAVVWTLDMVSGTRHRLHVGGSCVSDWAISGSVTIQPNGRSAGDAIARLRRPATCDFPQSQVQTRKIQLVVTGKLVGGSLRLSFSEAGRVPEGSQDLGGFTNTLSLIRPVFRLPNGTNRVRATVKATRPDGDLGLYSSDSACKLSLQ